MSFKNLKFFWMIALLVFSAGCASVQPLSQVADRARQPNGLGHDVVVDVANRDLPGVHKLAWVGYAVSLECESGCTLTKAEQQKTAADLAARSFASFDRELRAALEGTRVASPIELLVAQKSTANPAFATEIPDDSFSSRIGRWFERLKLSHEAPAMAAASGLKSIDPGELGWSGEGQLQKLAQRLGVDGVLVGHLKVTVGKDNERDVAGPKIWIFGAKKAKSLATAYLRQSWRIVEAPALDMDGIDAVAKAYSSRFAEEVRAVQ